MRSLSEFASGEGGALWEEARSLPEFFQHNLVDPARVVKVFSDDVQANIRIFYYQYLKLCFELDNVDYEGYISKIETVINNEGFKFIFYEDDDPALFSDMQFKSLIMQFFGVLGQGNVTIDDALVRYPIMDTVFVYFFRALLILTGRTESLDSFIDRQELFQFLCSYFGVEISLHDRCIKFVQTDIFTYEDNPKEVFMAYMDYEGLQNAQQAQLNQSQSQPDHQHSQLPQSQSLNLAGFVRPQDGRSIETIEQSLPASESQLEEVAPVLPLSKSGANAQAQQRWSNPAQNNGSHRGNTVINQSYISSDFVDYTSPTASNFSSLVPRTTLNDSGSIDGFRQNSSESAPKAEAGKFDYGAKADKGEIETFIKPASKPSVKKQAELASNYDSLSYSAQSNSYGNDKNTSYATNFNSYAAKSNVNEAVPAKVEEFKYVSKNEWEPTKDPGFSMKYGGIQQVDKKSQFTPSVNQYNSYTSTVSVQNTPSSSQFITGSYKFTPSVVNQYTAQTNQYSSGGSQFTPASFQKPPSPKYEVYQPKINNYQSPIDLYGGDAKKPSSYGPGSGDSLKNLGNTKPVSTETGKSEPPSISTYGSSQNQYGGGVANKGSMGRNVFNLNVSMEFTNSFTMKVMNEPYRSSVANIRTRARNYRNSLSNVIK